MIADAESGAGYIGYYDGGAFGIPYSSKNKEAALLWVQFIGKESVQADWAAAGARIVMESTFDDPLIVEIDQKVSGYYTLMRGKPALSRRCPAAFPQHAARELSTPSFGRPLPVKSARRRRWTQPALRRKRRCSNSATASKREN